MNNGVESGRFVTNVTPCDDECRLNGRRNKINLSIIFMLRDYLDDNGGIIKTRYLESDAGVDFSGLNIATYYPVQ